MNAIKAIETYQCLGCVCGSDTKCGKFKQSDNKMKCQSHVVGTRSFPAVGKFLLGLPKGFNRVDDHGNTELHLYENWNAWDGYNKFNVPIWKHLDEHGNTLVRMVMPRINRIWIQVFIGNHLDKIECLEITNADLDDMD